MARRTRYVSLFLALLGFAAIGCSELAKTKSANNRTGDTAAADAGANAIAQTTATASSTGTSAQAALTDPGIPSVCQYAAGSSATSGCFTCTPRELPIVTCVSIVAGFDPTKSCKHSDTALSCDVGAKAPFQWDLSQQSSMEQAYTDIPILVLGAKALLGTKLQDAKLQDLIFGTLDAVNTNKLALFTGGDSSAFFDAVAALVKKDEPSVTDAQIADFKTSGQNALGILQANYRAGKATHADILQLAESLLAAFPPELTSTLLGQLDLGKIIDNLNASGSSDSLATLLSSLTTGQTLEQILGSLTAAQASGSATSTTTTTATTSATDTGTTSATATQTGT